MYLSFLCLRTQYIKCKTLFLYQFLMFLSCFFLEYIWANNIAILFLQVNNVGMPYFKKNTDFPSKGISLFLTTNLESAYHLHPLLKNSGRGNIVFMSSVSGVVSMSTVSLFGATKSTYLFQCFLIWFNFCFNLVSYPFRKMNRGY